MNPGKWFARLVSLAVSISLALPAPAFALRNSQPEHQTQLSGLEEALTGRPRAQLAQLQASPAPSSLTPVHPEPVPARGRSASGLEEKATKGIGWFWKLWDPVAAGLAKFPKNEQLALWDEVKAFRVRARQITKKARIKKPNLDIALTGLIKLSPDPAEFREGLKVLQMLAERIVSKAKDLNTRSVKWNEISFDKLLPQAAKLIGQGIEFEVNFFPEEGHWEESSSDDSYSSSRGAGGSTYVVDHPQAVWLSLPEGRHSESLLKLPKPPVLNDEFLKTSGVFGIISQGISPDKDNFRSLLGQNQMSEWVAFDLNEIGISPNYFPCTILGKRVVIRIYPRGKEKTLSPVDVILLRGSINEKDGYEVIPRASFDALFKPDGLKDWWTYSVSPRTSELRLSTFNPRGELQLWQEGLALRLLSPLKWRNWNLMFLKKQNGERERTASVLLEKVNFVRRKWPQLKNVLREPQLGGEPLSLYGLGSFFWSEKANDLDIVVIVQGHYPLEILEPLRVDGFDFPVHLQVVGIDTLKRASQGMVVDNYHLLRIQAMVLCGSALPVAGVDLFEHFKIPPENLPKLAEHFRANIERLTTTHNLAEADRQSKAKRWSQEVTAIELFQTHLREEESFYVQLQAVDRLNPKNVHLAGYVDRIKAIGESPEDFLSNLNALKEFLLWFETQGGNWRDLFGSGITTFTRPDLIASRHKGGFEGYLSSLKDRISRLREELTALASFKTVDSHPVSNGEFSRIVRDVISLYGTGGYQIKVSIEKGHLTVRSDSEVSRAGPSGSSTKPNSGLEEAEVTVQRPTAEPVIQPMRFVVDTGKGDARVLELLRLAVQLRLGEQELPIRAAGVATAQELAQAQLRLSDPLARRLLEAVTYVYLPDNEADHRRALNEAMARVGLPSPDFVIREVDQNWIEWYLAALKELGVRDLTPERILEEIEPLRTAA